MSTASRHVVTFTAPHSVEVRDEPLPDPSADEVLVETIVSGISPGTERLVYRGEAPQNMTADSALASLGGDLSFPLRYGYCNVGRVVKVGANLDRAWSGQRVFAFQPHVSAFVSTPDALVPLPDDISDDAAVFLPNVETAVTLVMDGRPVLGENVVVFGQGVVGLLTTRLLGRHPVRVWTVEPSDDRRAQSKQLGIEQSVSPSDLETLRHALRSDDAADGADLVYELSGRPSVLDDALSVAGFDTRIVVGSWYGTKRAPIDLGRRFHRGRISITSSQVSTLAPRYRGRWTKSRRMRTALDLLSTFNEPIVPVRRYAVGDAPDAYRDLDAVSDDLAQPVLEYDT